MNRKIIALLSTVSMFAVNTAFATDIVVPPDLTSTLTLSTGDSLTVETNGSIDATGALDTSAVDVGTNINFIDNSGIIKADGTAGIKIYSSSNVAKNITNEKTGQIIITDTAGTAAYGILTFSGAIIEGDIINNGYISATSNASGQGMNLTGTSGNIINNGTIIANHFGMNLFNATINGSVINNGKIAITDHVGNRPVGISIADTSSVHGSIINSGVISAISTSVPAFGIQSILNNLTITNTGTISADGVGTHLEISSAAVDFTGGGRNSTSQNCTLNNCGGTLVGDVLFGTGADNTLNISAGQVVTAQGNYNVGVCGDGVAVRNGNTSAVVDFFSTSQAAQQITSSISDVVDNQINVNRSGHSNYFWTEGFGSYQERPAVKNAAQIDSTVGGILVGMDKHYDGKVIGVYAGGLKDRLKIINNTNTVVNGNGVILGAYGSMKLPHDSFVDVNIPIAYVHNKSSRTAKNNLAANGLENNTGSFNEYYIAPTVVLGKNFDYNKFTLTPSVKLTYIGQHVDGYTEQGGTSVQTTKSRFVNTIDGLAQVSLQKTLANSSEQPVQLAVNLGIERTQQIGSKKVDVSVIGVNSQFTPAGPIGYTDAVLGFSVNRGLMKKGSNIFAQIQGSRGITNPSAHNYKIALDAGIEVKF